MELIKNFGIDPMLLLAQAVNFLLVFYILKRFLYKPLLDLIKKREEAIQKGLSDSEKARLLLEETKEKESAILKNALAETKKLLDDARKEREEMIAKANLEAKEKTEQMLSDARLQIHQDIKEAEKKLAGKITILAAQMLKKTSAELIDKNLEEEALKKALTKYKIKAD